jgi:anti-anti-sigma factor
MASDRSRKGRGADPLRPPAPSELPDDRARRPGSELDVACREQADLILLTLVGALDTHTTPGFQEYARRYDPGKVQLVIDLVGVSFLDSAGLSALPSLCTQADRAGAQLGLVCPDPSVVRLFSVHRPAPPVRLRRRPDGGSGGPASGAARCPAAPHRVELSRVPRGALLSEGTPTDQCDSPAALRG